MRKQDLACILESEESENGTERAVDMGLVEEDLMEGHDIKAVQGCSDEVEFDYSSVDGSSDDESESEYSSVEASSQDPRNGNATRTTPILADKESNAAKLGKVLVFIVLVLAGAGMAIATNQMLSSEEQSDFEIAFESQASDILVSAETTFTQTVSFLNTITSALTSYSNREGHPFPFLTIPDYEVLTREILTFSGADFIGWCPLVSYDQKDAWAEYSVQNQWWIREGLDYQGATEVKPIPITPYIVSDSINPLSYYIPSWQYAPAPSSPFLVNQDLLNRAWFRRTSAQVMKMRHGILSEVADFASALLHESSPRSGLLMPVFSNFSSQAPVVGFLSLILPFEEFFSGVASPGSGTLLVEVTDSCGTNLTYAIRGADISFLGVGLLHDPRYDGMAVRSPYAVFHMNETHDMSSICNHFMTIYPTDEFKADYESNKPFFYTVAVLGIFFFAIVVFLVYDGLVRRQHAKVFRTAKQTTALVASLFPQNVQLRILREAEERADAEDLHKKSSFNVKSELKKMLANGNELTIENGTMTPSDQRNQKSKPIADLFTDTTIMFADIVGFTAWSSTREPTQVFSLLETIYEAFDNIATKRRVFKVETVGDCYVAVAGLPDPRKDHAVVMARFAKDCLRQFGKLTKRMEVELGPDTGDLGLRVGIHSGSVTAGVLRGQRTRFQLFGDTVNTTARLETTGERNKIHISKVTAALLQESGKGHWCYPRDEKVVAKGKGELETYWLDVKGGRISNKSSSNVESDEPSETPDKSHHSEKLNPEGLSLEPAPLYEKHMRLVDWNTEMLAQKLKEVVAHRENNSVKPSSPLELRSMEVEILRRCSRVMEELEETISLPNYSTVGEERKSGESVKLNESAVQQLRDYIRTLSVMYHDNPFHNFEHASHVTMSVTKLFSRILALELSQEAEGGDVELMMHDHTYGIASDPLTQFTVILSALIHDVDHPGVPNAQLVKEGTEMAQAYNNKSVAEQNSIDIAWGLLMDERYMALRRTIYTTGEELTRFRQLFVNTVLATDIMDKNLKALRNSRWDRAFAEGLAPVGRDEVTAHRNRKATIVIEHLIQASDVAHTMQHWHVYRKWNARLFEEMYLAYRSGRAEHDPSETWYEGEIGFFDFYIIPLAKKLKECGVFGVCSEEYLSYALQNRAEWELKGRDVIAELLDRVEGSSRQGI